MNKGRNILIVGGAGFLGSHCAELLAQDHSVTVLDDLSTGSRENLPSKKIRFVEESLLSDKARKLLRTGSFDYIINCAANAYIKASVEDPAADFVKNCILTFTLLETVRTMKTRPRVLLVSSSAVLGETRKQPMDEHDPLSPVSPYGASKAFVEQYAKVYAGAYGVPVSVVRCFPMFGPRQKKQVVYDLLRKIHSPGPVLSVIGTGNEERDLLYVGDAAAGMVRIMGSAGYAGEVTNLCTGKAVSIQKLAQTLIRLTGAEKEIVFTGTMRSGDVNTMVGSVKNLKKSGFRPAVSLEDGLKKTVSWFRDATIR